MGTTVNTKLGALGSYPIVLAQTAVPMILPSSGTMGANGALTGLTALPYSAFPQPCFMYFPAGKVYSGSAAGMYYASITAATTATVYNNIYTNGLPQAAIPASPTAVVDAGPGAYTQTTGADIVLMSFTLPGGMMGPNGALRADSLLAYNNSAGNKIYGLKLGGVGGPDIFSAVAYTTSNCAQKLRFVKNRGVANSQIMFGSWNELNTNGSATKKSNVDTSVDQGILFLAQIATATDFAIVESATIEVIQG